MSIYNSSAPDQVAFLGGHCEAKVAIVDDVEFLERLLKVRGELPALQHVVDLVTLIYTSGTTGNPKGVMIDHANVAWEVGGYATQLAEVDSEGHIVPSYLPMAHIAERMVSHYAWLYEGIEVVCVPD
ncbi:MAG: AMP-binding protein, partial [Actinomycetia bacterium]|nr:AMP-binding protein [Actinomycetes bacterium]